MDHFKIIYRTQAQAYDELIQAEDFEGNLERELSKLVSFENKRILDLGTGTGRIPLLFHHKAKSIIGLDFYRAMLQRNRSHSSTATKPWFLVQGDMLYLPMADDSVEITIAAWAVGHLRSWYLTDWEKRIDSIVKEMDRVTVNGGYLIVIETMGTGCQSPAPPTSELADYYQRLAKLWYFRKIIIRTDYVFENLTKAVQKTKFFFGDELSDRIRENHWTTVPEWTGIWWKQV